MQKHNKKGLSEVITAILVILLVLVAIGIIWVVVQKFMTQGQNQAEGGINCITVQLSVASVIKDTTTTPKYVVTINRAPGGGSSPVNEAKLVFKNDAGNSIVIDKTTVQTLGTLNLAELGQRSVDVSQISVTGTVTNPTSVAIAGVFSGNTCNPSEAKTF